MATVQRAAFQRKAEEDGKGQRQLSRQDSQLVEDGASVLVLAGSIMSLFFPIFASRLAWIGMKTTDTALLGHAGTDFLSASSLSDFYTGAFGPLMQDSVLNSKVGPAYGAGNKDMVCIWVQVSATVYAWATLFIIAAFCTTGPALHYGLGTPEPIAGYAGYYSTVMALCLPARFINGKITAFFTAQAKTRPSRDTTVLALLLNLVFGLQLVLGIPLAALGSYGFWACPIVTTCVEWFITALYFFVYCGLLRYHDECWGAIPSQWSVFRDVFLAPVVARADSEHFAYYNEHIKPRIREYVRLAFPANLALASDFWRMSAIGLLAGTLGEKNVAVFNASYRLAWMNMTVIGSFSSAACTQLGIMLGTGSGTKCKKIVGFGVSTVVAFLVATAALTVVFVEPLASIFSSDPEVIELFGECGAAIGFMIFFMCLSMHFELILFAIGASKVVSRAAILGSWVGQVPAVLLMIRLMGRQLQAVYIGVGIGYAFYLVLVFVPFVRTNWDEEARMKSEEHAKKQHLVEK